MYLIVKMKMKMNKTKRRKRRSLRHVGGVVLTKRFPDMNMTVIGDFDKRKLKGNAKIKFDSGETYEGPCNSNLNPHGEGTMTFPDGTVFVGEFNNGEKSGVGKINYADGSVYEGEFAEDAPHGRGKYTTPKGVYNGHLHYGHKQGLGKMTFVSGDVYEGIFNEDRIEGPGILTKPDGTVVYEGNFRETKDGLFRVIELEDEMPPMEPHPDFDPAQAAALHAQSSADVKAHNLAVRRAQIAASVAAARRKQSRQKETLAAIVSGDYDHAPPSVVAARLKFGK
jgi:hypothetical protein